MNKENKVVIGIVVAIIALFGFLQLFSSDQSLGANTNAQLAASSTQYTLTTTSQRLLASSTRRVAASVNNYNCTSANIGVFLNFETDVAATVANADYVVFASSSDVLSVETGNPPSTDSITGITDSGTCTVIVTEWRKR